MLEGGGGKGGEGCGRGGENVPFFVEVVKGFLLCFVLLRRKNLSCFDPKSPPSRPSLKRKKSTPIDFHLYFLLFC